MVKSQKDVKDKYKKLHYAERVRVMKNGKQVASAQNLEVIDRYRRKESWVKSVRQVDDILIVKYEDGAKVVTKFADPSILKRWIHNKKKRGLFP